MLTQKAFTMLRFLLFISTLFFLGCSHNYAPLPTTKKVEIKCYLGTWYEIARYEHFFEKGCSNVSATYTLQEDKIGVLNRCQKEDKTYKEATGIAYATDASFAKLKVSFFRPFYGNYHILMLDEAYSYAVIGEPSREYFWILSRTPKLEQKTVDEIITKMPSLGYDASQLIWTLQNEEDR